MPIDLKLSRLTFQRLGRELVRLSKSPAPASVHKFRTQSRRVEALLGELAPEIGKSEKKLLKKLSRLRKKAGRVRDLDVGIAALRSLKIPEGNGHRSQFIDNLMEERSKRERKLAEAFDQKTIAELAKRLRRVAIDIHIPKDTEPLTLALDKFTTLLRDHQTFSERTLHRYRIVGKLTRYIAEVAGDDPQARTFVDQLKHMQDVIGDWHDWLKLTLRAEALFGGVRDSALVAMLRNVTQAKFRQSIDAVAQIRASLAGTKPVSRSANSIVGPKPIVTSSAAKTAAA